LSADRSPFGSISLFDRRKYGLKSGSLKPSLQNLQLEEIVETHGFFESNEQFGKIVVTV
jgi:hypothetical protein